MAASLPDDIRPCKAETDSLKRLTCFDEINATTAEAEHSFEGESGSKPALTVSTESAVEFVSAQIRRQAKDYDRRIYSDRIKLVPTFGNKTKKTVVAIANTLAVTDAFGETIMSQPGKLDIKIAPGETVESSILYFWEDNTFLANDAYGKLVEPVSMGTAKPMFKVTKVIFADGSIEDFNDRPAKEIDFHCTLRWYLPCLSYWLIEFPTWPGIGGNAQFRVGKAE